MEKKEIGLFVAVPFGLLKERYVDALLDKGLCPEIGLDARTLDQCDPASERAIFERLRQRGLSYTFHFPFVDMDPGSPDSLILNATKERFRQAIGWVKEFQPELVVTHTGYYPQAHGEIRDEWLSVALETFKWLGGELKRCSVPMVIENVFEKGPDDLLSLVMPLMGLRVGVCLDVGHLTAFSDAPLVLWLQELYPFIYHLHLHDNRGHKDEHLGLGWGKVDFLTLFHLLGKLSAPICTITIEAHQEEMVLPTIQRLKEICPYPLRDMAKKPIAHT